MRYPSENSRKEVERTMVDVGWIHTLIWRMKGREKKRKAERNLNI